MPRSDELTPAQARVTRLTDPLALRAYAHPTRLQLVGLLRTEGPFTATRAAELTGESVASCSYHLRMLAKYGLVEPTGGGQGREKPWRATARYTEWPDYSEDPAVAEASRALQTAVAERYFETMNRVIEERPDLPRAWQEVTGMSDSVLHLTAGEVADFNRKFEELLRPYEERAAAERPADTRPVQVIRAALPLSPRTLPDAKDGGPA